MEQPALPMNMAHTYSTVQCRLIITQKGNLEVRADESPIDSPLAGIFLNILQYCAGLTKQLFTWWEPKQVLLRALRECTVGKRWVLPSSS